MNYLDPTTWNDSNQEIGFRIERAPVDGSDAGVFTTVATAPANSTTFTYVPPDPTITYDYRVTAFNEAGAASSTAVRVEGLPASPTGAERRGGTRCQPHCGWQGRPRLDERVAHGDERRSRARRRRRPVQPGGHRDPSGRRPGDLHRHFGDGRRRLQLPGQGGQRHRCVGVLQRRHGEHSARSLVDGPGQ